MRSSSIFRCITFAVVGVSLLITSSSLAEPFTAPSGYFTVDFPGKPVEKHSLKKTFVGKIEETWFSLDSKDGRFLVGYTRLPGIVIFFGGQNHLLHRVKEIFLDTEGAQERSFTDTNVDGRSAKALLFEKSDGSLGRAYFIFLERRVFLVTASSPRGLSVVDAFLTSFRLPVRRDDESLSPNQ